MKQLGVRKMIGLAVAFWAVAGITLQGQTFRTMPLDGTDGAGPYGAFVQGTDGNYYGTTSGNNGGTVFRLTPSGNLMTIYQFCSQTNCADGWFPFAGLVLGSNGEFYGTTLRGGTYGGGTVFQITRSGALSTLYDFGNQAIDAQVPYGSLAQGPNGNFYGTTRIGGTYELGTVFEITPAGKLTILHNFCSVPSCSDGQNPESGMVLGTNGDFYGTTVGGGLNEAGTIFEITPSGKLITIYSFCSQSECADGSWPDAPLSLGSDGNLYGTTSGPGNAGTVFRITEQGVLTTLYSFCSQYGCTDGSNPFAGVVQDADGNLYGTTEYGGILECPPGLQGCGAFFEISSAGQFTVLHTFCTAGDPCSDGMYPATTLLQGTNGILYGATLAGGGSNICNDGGCGTLFSSSMGLTPFVEANPGFGIVGSIIMVLGDHLANTTSVTFNGVEALFKVISETYIKVKVPADATTGAIEVISPSGNVSSKLPFQVIR